MTPPVRIIPSVQTQSLEQMGRQPVQVIGAVRLLVGHERRTVLRDLHPESRFTEADGVLLVDSFVILPL